MLTERKIYGDVWTEDRVAQLVTLTAEGYSAAQVARVLGESFTRSCVLGKRQRMGLVSPGLKMVSHVKAPLSRALPAPHLTLVVAEPKPLPVSRHQCKWPIGDPGEAGFHVCTGSALVNKPYCAEHHAISVVPEQTSSKKFQRSLRRVIG